MERELKLKFDPRTIEHLGIKMYSKLPHAIAEIIANSFDSMAKRHAARQWTTSSWGTAKEIAVKTK